MAEGDIIRSGVPRIATIPAKIGPTEAMRRALAAYLLGISFTVDGGDDPRDSTFQLNFAIHRWPRPDEDLIYPCVSIFEVDGTEHDQPISPEPLEDTIGRFDHIIGYSGATPQTCLWVTGEANVEFQVDFWCDRDPDRQAIEAQLANIFSPEEGRSSVVVEGPQLYYGSSCEFALISSRFDDSGTFSERNEKRLRCSVQASCAILSLRMAILAKPATQLEVIDPIDPEDSAT